MLDWKKKHHGDSSFIISWERPTMGDNFGLRWQVCIRNPLHSSKTSATTWANPDRAPTVFAYSVQCPWLPPLSSTGLEREQITSPVCQTSREGTNKSVGLRELRTKQLNSFSRATSGMDATGAAQKPELDKGCNCIHPLQSWLHWLLWWSLYPGHPRELRQDSM